MGIGTRVDATEQDVQQVKGVTLKFNELNERLEHTDHSVKNSANLDEGGKLDRMSGRLQFTEQEVLHMSNNSVKFNTDLRNLDWGLQSIDTRFNTVNSQVYADINSVRVEMGNLRQEIEQLKTNMNQGNNSVAPALVTALTKKVKQLEQPKVSLV